MSRRAFLRPNRRQLLTGGGAALGLAVGWSLWPRHYAAPILLARGEEDFGPFLKIGHDGHIAVIVPACETGQGQSTFYAQIIADELGADWRTVSVEPAIASPAYANHAPIERDAMLATPRMVVPDALAQWGGWRHWSLGDDSAAMLSDDSLFLGDVEQALRTAAAFARALLAKAAAARWDADWEGLDCVDGFVVHGARRLRFGELAAEAAALSPPSYPPLRAPGAGKLWGVDVPRLDLPAKVDGSMAFAGDVRLPDMLFAAIRQGPFGDTRLKNYNRRAADRVMGFVAAVRHERWLAAVANNGWAAQRALDAMAPRFLTEGVLAESSVIDRRLKAALASGDGARIFAKGSIADAFDGRPVLGADYAIAPQLHATLETRSATAMVDGDVVRIWAAAEAPGTMRVAIADALGVAASAVSLFVMPGGGSLGAAMEVEVAVQAALIARAMRRPVQLCWSRTEEVLRDLPRAPQRVRLQASLSSGATIDALRCSLAAPAARHEWRARLAGDKADAAQRDATGVVDAAALEGAMPPYQIPNLALDHLPVDIHMPAGRWRGRAAMGNIFALECFIDELARAADSDPFGFRMAMLGETPALAEVLQAATAAASWDGGAAGSGMGLALAALDGSYIAVCARARPSAGGIRVSHLYVRAHVGRVLNPRLTLQQLESGVMLGLAQAVGGTSRYHRGLARARHWRDLNIPSLAQMPEVDIDILPSDQESAGIGAIGMLAVAPAIANALYTISGQRIRRLPLSSKPLA